ncbi:hypothetical protein CTZ27_35435 [Streptomyces griseocarneus]|nr:hypothetical protein CTZ27_35435 [Streptomyces griseocarneus]
MTTEEIPAAPVYTITLTTTGIAAIDGETLGDTGQDADAARRTALAEITVKAALHGRPVRATAKEPDGIVYYLIVAPDGTVTTCNQPHPIPPPPRASAAPRRTASSSPQGTSAQVPADKNSTEWAAPLPEGMTSPWAQLVRQAQTGAYAEAVHTANRITASLRHEYGLHHPHTVNILTTRAWLALRARTEPAEVAELLVEAAELRREAKAQPEQDTLRLIHNAHTLWHHLATQDPETARELAERLLTLLHNDPHRTHDIINWAQNGGTAMR